MLQAIRARHSVRAYKSDALPKQKLEQLVDAMRLAPSGNNEQAWKFIVVTGDNRPKVAAACVQEFVAEAPAIIVALSQKGRNDYNLAFAVDHLLLEAASEGLGTVVIRSFNEDEVKKVLQVPEGYAVFALVPVGYPRGEAVPSGRKSLTEVVSWETF